MKASLWLISSISFGFVVKPLVFTANEAIKGIDDNFSEDLELEVFMIVTEWSSLRQKQLHDCMRTMQFHLEHTCNVHFHVLVDTTTAYHVLNVLNRRWCQVEGSNIKISLYNLQEVQMTILPYHHRMMNYFSSENNLYYNRTIFFVEALLHKVLPEVVRKVMVFDIDIMINSSIRELYGYFEHFSASHLIGLAFEQQPTYMHYTAEYRKYNPSTQIGSPPPYGNPGFNSGVILMDLEKLRNSDIYNNFLSSVGLHNAAEKYSFQGNLGDQDFFSLLSFDYPELFYVLPCTWNRQLCRLFEQRYHEHFTAFHDCQGDIYIYHGNCNTSLPELL